MAEALFLANKKSEDYVYKESENDEEEDETPPVVITSTQEIEQEENFNELEDGVNVAFEDAI